MFISNRHLSRRTVLRGLGASLSLPLLDAMIPARGRAADTLPRARLVAIEMVHGAAGSTEIGAAKNYWSPAREGLGLEITPTLKSLEPLREYVTIVSNTELHNAMSLVPEENGPMADHARSSAVFLTAAHPRRAGSEIEAGPSIDQIYAREVGRETPLTSLELCIEDDSMGGVCGHGYSCAYTHTISWASPTTPVPMEQAPRRVFDRMFAAGAGARTKGSILDSLPEAAGRLKKRVGARDRGRVGEYLDAVRDVERRIQQVERENASGQSRALTNAPLSVPDSFDDHVKLMFDLQVLAFTADITRVTTFKMGIDRSARVYPQSGVTSPFHELSHHREEADKVAEFARLNQYHVSKAAYFLERLRSVPDGDGNLLDHSVVLYGSPMGDSHVHGHKRLPLFLAGRANGALRGNLHVRCAEDTPMANVLLTVMRRLGVGIDRIGDSTGEVDI